MAVSFTTHFGSISHGVLLEWTNDPTATTPTLTCLMTANMYADLLLASKTVTDATYYLGTSGVYSDSDVFSSASAIYDGSSNLYPQFEFLVIMQNAASDCTGVCRDGWQVLLDQVITY